MAEKLLEKLNKGWGFCGLKKFHYFENGISACKKYHFDDPILRNGNDVLVEMRCQKCHRIFTQKKVMKFLS